jgi:hypothetical protein
MLRLRETLGIPLAYGDAWVAFRHSERTVSGEEGAHLLKTRGRSHLPLRGKLGWMMPLRSCAPCGTQEQEHARCQNCTRKIFRTADFFFACCFFASLTLISGLRLASSRHLTRDRCDSYGGKAPSACPTMQIA